MKITLNTNEAAYKLMRDDNANWSFNGAQALVEYLEAIEEDTGEDIEFDLVAIRCDYSEYKDLQQFAEARTNLENADDDSIREHIEDRGVLVDFNGGIIVSNF